MEVGPVTVLSVSEAEVEVQRFRKAEESLSADLQAIRKKVADAEQVAGSRILDAKMSGNDAGSKSVVQELRSMEIERETTERALKSATYGRNMAEINLLRSRADEKREEAAGIRDQVTEREEKTAVARSAQGSRRDGLCPRTETPRARPAPSRSIQEHETAQPCRSPGGGRTQTR